MDNRDKRRRRQKDCPLESTVGKGEERKHHRHQHHDGRRWLAWENPDQVRFNNLFSFLFRYGDTWTPWRLMQNQYNNSVEKTLELDASSREAINWITGYSANDDGNGRTYFLRGSTTAGRSFQHPTWKAMFGKHDGGKSPRNSPDAELRLPLWRSDRWQLHPQVADFMQSNETGMIVCIEQHRSLDHISQQCCSHCNSNLWISIHHNHHHILSIITTSPPIVILIEFNNSRFHWEPIISTE